MRQQLLENATSLLIGLLKPVHQACVEAFRVYQSLMQAGWYEAFDHTQRISTDSTGCPVKRLIRKQENLISNKDVIA